MTISPHPGGDALHVLLDRDGVLNVEAAGAAVRAIQDWRWERGALAGLALLAERGWDVSIVTNQSAVARGELRHRDLEQLHAEVSAQVRSMGVQLLGVHACTHEDRDGCECRKPRSGMVETAVASSTVPKDRTVMIGDDLRDLNAAHAAGVRAVLVRTGKGARIESQVVDVDVLDDLHAAVRHLMGGPGPLPSSSHPAALVRHQFDAHLGVVEAAREVLSADLGTVASELRRRLGAGATVFAVGNGGSAADAQHFVAELVGRFGRERAPMRAAALGTDGVASSAMANDFGYEHALARELRSMARPGDALVAISTSGDSANVCAAASAAHDLGCWTVALTGARGGRLASLADVTLRAPAHSTPRVQEIHSLCLHTIASLLDADR